MSRRGQGLVEAALVILVFVSVLLAVFDCGQVIYAHQALLERVRDAVRWGTLHPFDGTGDQVANLIVYGQTTEPRERPAGNLGLTRANVQVRYQSKDEILSVAIVNYESHLYSPWIAQTIVSPRPILVSAPMADRAVRAR